MCHDDIVRMARKLEIKDIDVKDEAELLEDTICWLEDNAGDELSTFIKSCRNKFDEMYNGKTFINEDKAI